MLQRFSIRTQASIGQDPVFGGLAVQRRSTLTLMNRFTVLLHRLSGKDLRAA
jgi:hypothetical protein